MPVIYGFSTEDTFAANGHPVVIKPGVVARFLSEKPVEYVQWGYSTWKLIVIDGLGYLGDQVAKFGATLPEAKPYATVAQCLINKTERLHYPERYADGYQRSKMDYMSFSDPAIWPTAEEDQE